MGNEGYGPLLRVYQIRANQKNILKSILDFSGKGVLNIISEEKTVQELLPRKADD